MIWAIIALVVVLPLCFVPILMALDTREDDRRTREHEAEREAFYARLRADQDAFYARMRASREAFYEEFRNR